MASYEPFCDQMLTNIAVWWMANHLTSVQITIGPLSVYWRFDIYNSTIRIYTYDAGETDAGSSAWYGSEYVVFRCVYWFLRNLGIRNWEWEIQDAFDDFDFILYEETMRPYHPHIRVQYPHEVEHPIYIENLWSETYMLINPRFDRSIGSSDYPCGDSTLWVDSILTKNTRFNMNLVQGLSQNVDGEESLTDSTA